MGICGTHLQPISEEVTIIPFLTMSFNNTFVDLFQELWGASEYGLIQFIYRNRHSKCRCRRIGHHRIEYHYDVIMGTLDHTTDCEL